jgi:hypothetical protein
MAMDSQEMEKEITCLLTSDPDRFILIRGELENQELVAKVTVAEGSSVSGHIANPRTLLLTVKRSLKEG